jgi:Kef-type K+ transport system membrane component KefB
MNARGLMELIIINIGLSAGVILPGLFSIRVLMAVVTTLMATPLFNWIVRRQAATARTEDNPGGQPRTSAV